LHEQSHLRLSYRSIIVANIHVIAQIKSELNVLLSVRVSNSIDDRSGIARCVFAARRPCVPVDTEMKKVDRASLRANRTCAAAYRPCGATRAR
jgi:hypothetical protein